jgi:DNA-binding transcriptional ArsR family regulator
MSRRASPAAIHRDVRAAAPLFAALGDTTRLRIVSRLAVSAGLSIAALTAGTGVTRQAVTKHLRVLDRVGLVESRWHGRERVWQLKPSELETAHRALDRIAAEWGDTLGRLKRFVEREPGQA